MDEAPFYLDADNLAAVQSELDKVLTLALKFKTREAVSRHHPVEHFLKKYVVPLPELGCAASELEGFLEGLLEESINWSSPMFMGFNDAGNSVAGLMGSLIEGSCQQNLINSDFCARSATFVEIATVRWLRELSGYANAPKLHHVGELGGVATTGGTASNMYGLLMARKKAYPDSFKAGLPKTAKPRILVPGELCHYSVPAAAGLVGFGTESLLKVPTKDYAYDKEALERCLKETLARGEQPVCAVINVGDSRTLTLDDMAGISRIVKACAPDCWIHADACNGGQLLFSQKYRDRLKGLETADSIALDPHKVFNIPYASSYFLFKDPGQAAGFWTSSTLIMRDPWALGQLTPNIGSKTWSSLKLYLLVKHLGRKGLAQVIDRRLDLAARFRAILAADPRFRLVTRSSDCNSVPFIYVGGTSQEPEQLYRLNEKLYGLMLKEGSFYVHGFPMKDDADCLSQGRSQKLFMLRFMSGHPAATEEHLERLHEGLARLGAEAARS